MPVLIVPDKRYCFDHFQPYTDSAKVLADAMRDSQRHSFEAFYRSGMNVSATCMAMHAHHWGPGAPVTDVTFVDLRPDDLLITSQENTQCPVYVDTYENYSTASSFAVLIAELAYVSKMNVGIETLTRSRKCEFLAILRKHQRPTVSLNEFQEQKKAFLFRYLHEETEQLAQHHGSGESQGWPLVPHTRRENPALLPTGVAEVATLWRQRVANWLRRVV